ncbi:MAG: hypothetical protein PHO91_02595 [Patescibacteria group bacterium]|nr:hypothetical protein [Patescibacteria group bacterium]
MKSDFHFHFYSRLGIMAIFLLLLFFVHQSIKNPVLTQADPVPEDSPIAIGDWVWSDILGWISLNCFNDFDGDGQLDNTCDDIDYGLNIVNVSGTNHIQGCAWAGTPLNIGGFCQGNGAACTIDANCGIAGPCQTVTLGWICFSDPGSTNAPANGIALSSTYLNALSTDQYASIVGLESLGDLLAWRLRFPIEEAVASPPAEINGCFNCYEQYQYACRTGGANCFCPGNVDSCVNLLCPPAEKEAFGICQAVNINYNCDNCLEYDYYNADTAVCSQTGADCSVTACEGENNICLQYQAGDMRGVIGGYDCIGCTIENYDNICGTSAYQGNLNHCQSCDSYFSRPGVMVDYKIYDTDNREISFRDRAYMCGWAYNQWQDDDYSLGWLQFSSRISTTTRPFIEVSDGSVYSRGDIFARYYPPYNRANASFLIESGGTIRNFISSSTLEGRYQGEMPSRPAIDFFSYLSQSGKYQNVLGTVDYRGLITPAYQSGGNAYNKYGSQVVRHNNPNTFSDQFNQVTNGKTIHFQGNLTTGGFSIKLGETGIILPQNASVVVVVEGDLTITSNIIYDPSTAVSNLKMIPSIVWVVRGDVYVHPEVSTIAGTFIILGAEDSTTCSGGLPQCSLDPYDADDASCGRFVSCNSNNPGQCANNSLTVNGNVLARRFELCRGFYDPANLQPSELFINDGRLQANPPFGFVDFSRMIPRFSETLQ